MRTVVLPDETAATEDFFVLEAESDFLLPILVALLATVALPTAALRPATPRDPRVDAVATPFDARLPAPRTAAAAWRLLLLAEAFLAAPCLAGTAEARAA
ncbi:MAG: hypothetical protein Q4E06_07345 [Lautropia sp.]|nr:hypothetical protein [Lautropia sp.]